MTAIEIFMTGFGFAFAVGLMSWGAAFVRGIVSGGRNE